MVDDGVADQAKRSRGGGSGGGNAGAAGDAAGGMDTSGPSGSGGGGGCGGGDAPAAWRAGKQAAPPPAGCSGGQGDGGLAHALDQFRTGVSGLEGMLGGLVVAASAEREALARERSQLAEERRALDQERSRVQQVLCDSEQVTLNVGGARFTTTVSTLRGAPAPSLFNAMFSGRHELQRAHDGSIFIDRDGRHFADVLNYLRTRQLAYPLDGTDYKYLLELRAEAEFYGLSGLTAAIDRFPWSLLRAARAACVEEDAHWLYEENSADEVVLRVDAPCQLLGVGLCGTHGGYTAEVQVLQVSDDDFESIVANLGSGTRTVTRADGKVARLHLFEPVPLLPGCTYMLTMVAKGSDSFVGEDCLPCVVAGGVKITLQCWESANGTNELRGQFPELYIRPTA
ncbi:MAG: hypothetical protein J3K34DRAFT_521739 [Monoraphidium minutum]|nr:MAG: hypothetical protein J3K34DRAFT_521739 [Monoraphidium minutum]